ncbi:hypothetical protein Tco_1045419 [Tanacetum coccineum]|uniref:Gag protein n=1 Tax=Tanacetum coccineum TaxID=301880 RepID=A0ABQ5GTS5_9ASTR
MAPKKAPALTEANINRLIQERIDESIAAERERVQRENNPEVTSPAPTPAPTTNLATNPAPVVLLQVLGHKSMAMMTEEFCPPEEIQRMEHELWNLNVKDYNITAYTTHFNELILLCREWFP